MGTLNPDLLSKDMDAVMNDAVALKDQLRKPVIMPELILLALLRRKDTAADRLLQEFKSNRGIDLERLDRQVVLAIETRRDPDGNLTYVASGNRQVPLSRQAIILVDDALSLANSQDQVRVDTDHALAVLAETAQSTSGLLRQHGITPKAINDLQSENSQLVRMNSTTQDYVALAKIGKLRAVYFRESLLRDMSNILSQSVNRHLILIGPDGVGKRTLAYSLALRMSEGKGPKGLKSLVVVDETALLDSDQKAIRAGLNQARGGVMFIPHIHRFFGGPIKAEFGKATPMIQKAFLSDDPVIIGTTTESEWTNRVATASGIAENCQTLRVSEPTVEETIEILKVLHPHLERDYGLKVEQEALALSARLAKRYMSATPLPRSAEQLIHRAAAMVTMSNTAKADGKAAGEENSS